eukprot:PhF_6_TR5173/c0_g1_i3/m.7411
MIKEQRFIFGAPRVDTIRRHAHHGDIIAHTLSQPHVSSKKDEILIASELHDYLPQKHRNTRCRSPPQATTTIPPPCHHKIGKKKYEVSIQPTPTRNEDGFYNNSGGRRRACTPPCNSIQRSDAVKLILQRDPSPSPPVMVCPRREGIRILSHSTTNPPPYEWNTNNPSSDNSNKHRLRINRYNSTTVQHPPFAWITEEICDVDVDHRSNHNRNPHHPAYRNRPQDHNSEVLLCTPH